jgi:UDP-glucose 4-epimerase
MRVLVTGGFGYLGGRIAQSLCSNGHKIILGSRGKHESPGWLPNVETAQLEWNNFESLRAICKEVDVIIHAAGVNSQDSFLDPLGANEFNGVATERLVKASIGTRVSNFIYLSTAHVYCSPLIGKITEESYLLNEHPYASSHRAGEDGLLSVSQTEFFFKGVVLRLSNGVGAPANRNSNCWMLAVNDFCRQLIENGKIEVNSPQGVERDFFPISLLCNTISSIINLDKMDERIINVSSAKTMSLIEIIELITKRSEKLFGFEPEVEFKNKDLISNKVNLKISNNKLRKIVKIEDSLELEIDQLLLRCKEWFGRK